MENKKISYGLFAGVLIIGLISITQFNHQNTKIETLEYTITQYKTQLTIIESNNEYLEDQVSTLQTTNLTLSETVERLLDSLNASQQNSSSLKTTTRILTDQINEQEDTIMILDDAIAS